MPRKAQPVKPVIKASVKTTVTYLGALPVVYMGVAFNPGQPREVPAGIADSLRSKPAFQVNDGNPD